MKSEPPDANADRSQSTIRSTLEHEQLKRIPAIFYRTEAGNEPVRAWLKEMPAADRRLIGEDIKTVEFGWPVGMPTGRPVGEGIFEVRTNLPENRISRVFFYVDKHRRMVLLHGILKKTRRLHRLTWNWHCRTCASIGRD